jgi:hypothetical protein
MRRAEAEALYRQVVEHVKRADPRPEENTPEAIARYMGGLELGLELGKLGEGYRMLEAFRAIRAGETYIEDALADLCPVIGPHRLGGS